VRHCLVHERVKLVAAALRRKQVRERHDFVSGSRSLRAPAVFGSGIDEQSMRCAWLDQRCWRSFDTGMGSGFGPASC